MSMLSKKINDRLTELRKQNLTSDRYKTRAKDIIYEEASHELMVCNQRSRKIVLDYTKQIDSIKKKYTKLIEGRKLDDIRSKIDKA